MYKNKNLFSLCTHSLLLGTVTLVIMSLYKTHGVMCTSKTTLGCDIRISETPTVSQSTTNWVPEDPFILQYPAARALQVLGYPTKDVTRAVQHCQQRKAPITAERLLNFISKHGLESREAKIQDSDLSQSSERSSKNSLVKENERLKMMKTCKICLGTDVQTLFLPCRHLTCCEQCANSIRNCPMCRRLILGTVKTYFA